VGGNCQRWKPRRKEPTAKTICDVAIKKERCIGVVQKVFVFDEAGSNGSDWEEEDIHVRFSELVHAQRPVCYCKWMDAEDPFFILYTFGSTGHPKGSSMVRGPNQAFALLPSMYG
jgi:acetyl-CoA synthetase